MTSPQLQQLLLQDRTPDCLALIAKEASIHKPHRTLADKEAVLNRLCLQGSVQRRQKHISPSLSLKEIYLHILKAAA